MRALLLALILALFPGTAAAQSQAAVQEFVAWAQQLSAAQQPVLDSHQQCSPMLGEVTRLMQDREEGDPVSPRLIVGMQECLSRMKAAAAQARRAIASLPDMPGAFEDALNLDSRELIDRSVASVDGAVGYLQKVEDALEAGLAGDDALAQARMREARQAAGSILDGQILLLELFRQSKPQESNLAMLDIRLVIARGMLAAMTDDPQAPSPALPAELAKQSRDARAAAARLRAAWKLESVSLRASARRTGDPKLQRFIAAIDKAFGTVAAKGDAAADALDAAAAASDPAVLPRLLNALGDAEFSILQAGRDVAQALTLLE
ncbi:hypothetical protein ACFQ1E_11990 [Sphingomonas canadensis]|uniref:Uncharacterized protein n=1 Tax=Sphingomonas canadensis TaxID=1219257 RepID=A0ABW3HBR5_9SPHN|nr:hypothetical protein [Sphingomonas canadensis]MCW3836805.1 hypothetical protein [Sphingomonas canadensis]